MPGSIGTPVARMVCAAALIGGMIASGCLPAVPMGSQSPAPGTQAQRPGSIRIGKAIRGDLNGVLTFAAPIQTKGELSIVPRVSARLDQLKVDVGSRVRAGDVLVELDRSGLEEQVLSAQAAQASAEAKLATLHAGPKPEAMAQAQANLRAAQARVNALESTRATAELNALEQRVREARAALDQALAALQPDPQRVAAADAEAVAARTRLAQLQSDPTRANDRAAMDAARADVTRAEAAASAARAPTGSQAAAESARRDLQDAQLAQLLARVSTTAFDLDQARALLEVADAQVKLLSAPLSPEEIRAAEQRVEEAFAQAELARSRLRSASITAPINGVVIEIKARVGSTVGPSEGLLTLVPPDMQVIVQVDESQAAQVQVGQSANVSVEGFAREAFSGSVRAIAPILDPRTRSVAVQVDIPDPQTKLKPGMFAQLAIQVGQRAGVLMVPRDAVLRVGGIDPSAPAQSIVYTVAEGRVHKRIVSLGVSDGKNVEILQGLQEGTDLVLNPRADFLEGELISGT